MMASFFNILVHILFVWNNHTYKQEHILHRKLPTVLQMIFLLLEKVNRCPNQMLVFTWSPTRGEGSSGSHMRGHPQCIVAMFLFQRSYWLLSQFTKLCLLSRQNEKSSSFHDLSLRCSTGNELKRFMKI